MHRMQAYLLRIWSSLNTHLIMLVIIADQGMAWLKELLAADKSRTANKKTIEYVVLFKANT